MIAGIDRYSASNKELEHIRFKSCSLSVGGGEVELKEQCAGGGGQGARARLAQGAGEDGRGRHPEAGGGAQ